MHALAHRYCHRALLFVGWRALYSAVLVLLIQELPSPFVAVRIGSYFLPKV